VCYNPRYLGGCAMSETMDFLLGSAIVLALLFWSSLK
jgi:hypothetical protein